MRLAPHLAEDLAATADVVSEGAEQADGSARTYYGTSSFLFHDPQPPAVLGALLLDPHFRVLVLRRAREEAANRATGGVGTMRAEIGSSLRGGRLELLVDVEVVVTRMVRAGG